MSIEDGLRTHLLADVPVAALVVDAALEVQFRNRVYPIKLPQSPVYPSLTYEIISTIPFRGLAGDSGLEQARARIHCWAETYTAAVDLATKVRTAVADFSGLMGTTTVRSTKFETWNDIFEDVPEVYRRVADFMIAHV